MTSLDPEATDLEPRFSFDFHAIDPGDGQRLTTYWDVDPLCRGPHPVPDWVITDRGALDTELGILKTGKEGDVFLVERSVGETSAVMAAKRYRGEAHRNFHRSSDYAAGRRVRNTRDTRAMAKKTTHGRAVAAGQWANAEWESLKRLWTLGVPVPYPVQIDGTEILMELVTDPAGDPAPRLARERPAPELLKPWFDQLRDAMAVMATAGIAHGDLSPYNILVTGERLVIIDLPQVVDLVANPAGPDFLLRDCHNVCSWFVARGLAVDEHELFSELLACAW